MIVVGYGTVVCLESVTATPLVLPQYPLHYMCVSQSTETLPADCAALVQPYAPVVQDPLSATASTAVQESTSSSGKIQTGSLPTYIAMYECL